MWELNLQHWFSNIVFIHHKLSLSCSICDFIKHKCSFEAIIFFALNYPLSQVERTISGMWISMNEASVKQLVREAFHQFHVHLQHIIILLILLLIIMKDLHSAMYSDIRRGAEGGEWTRLTGVWKKVYSLWKTFAWTCRCNLLHCYHLPWPFHCSTLSSKPTFSKKSYPLLFYNSPFLSLRLISQP